MRYYSISRCSTKVLKPRRRKQWKKICVMVVRKTSTRSTMKLVKWEHWRRRRRRMGRFGVRMRIYICVRMCCTCSPSMLLGNVDFNEMDSRAEPYIKVFMLKMCRIRFAWFHCCNYSAVFSLPRPLVQCVGVRVRVWWKGTDIQDLTTKTSWNRTTVANARQHKNAPDTIVELKNTVRARLHTHADWATNTNI